MILSSLATAIINCCSFYQGYFHVPYIYVILKASLLKMEKDCLINFFPIKYSKFTIQDYNKDFEFNSYP